MEVRNLLAEIRCRHTDHVEMFAVIDEIYVFAVDKKVDENIRVDIDYQIPIREELINLFESCYIYRGTHNESMSQSNEDCGESILEENNEACDDN